MIKCEGQKVKYQHKNLFTSNIHVKYQSSSTHFLNFINRCQSARLQSQGHKVHLFVPTERFVKYQSFSTHYSNVINKVKVLIK